MAQGYGKKKRPGTKKQQEDADIQIRESFTRYTNNLLRRHVEGTLSYARVQSSSPNSDFYRGYINNKQPLNEYGSVIDGHQNPELLQFAESETARLRKELPKAIGHYIKFHEKHKEHGDWSSQSPDHFWEYFFTNYAGDIHGKLKKAGVDVYDGKDALFDSSGKYIDKDASGRIMDIMKDKKL